MFLSKGILFLSRERRVISCYIYNPLDEEEEVDDEDALFDLEEGGTTAKKSSTKKSRKPKKTRLVRVEGPRTDEEWMLFTPQTEDELSEVIMF